MDNEFSHLTSYTKSSGSSPKMKAFFYVGLLILLIGGAIVAGNYFLSGKKEVPQPVAKVSPTATPTPTVVPTETTSLTPTPSGKVTPSPTPKGKSTPTPTEAVAAPLRIEVLNGSGVSGAASKMASFLKSKGYGLSGTGNADAFDYQKTVIQIKKSKSSEAQALKKVLSTGYTVDPTIQTLAESSQSDAIVIVGAE